MTWEHLIAPDAHNISVFDLINKSGTMNLVRSNVVARTGSFSFRIYDNHVALFVTPNATKFVALGAQITNDPQVGVFSLEAMEGATVHARITFSAVSGKILVYRGPGTTLLGEVPNVVDLSMRFYDCKFLVHGTAGEVIVRNSNGDTIIGLTGVNTRNGGTGVIDRIRINSVNIYSYIYLDDIAVRGNDFCGPGGNYVRTAVGDGDDTAWTASAGQPFQCVNTIPPNFNAYIFATTGDTGARATFQGSSPDLATIDAVGVYAWAQLEVAGDASIRPVVKSGASYAQGQAQGIGTNAMWVKSFFETDPNTSAPWQKNAVFASQFGVEIA